LKHTSLPSRDRTRGTPLWDLVQFEGASMILAQIVLAVSAAALQDLETCISSHGDWWFSVTWNVKTIANIFGGTRLTVGIKT